MQVQIFPLRIHDYLELRLEREEERDDFEEHEGVDATEVQLTVDVFR